MKKKIYIDLDGVIVNWMEAACKTCGVDPKEPAIRARLKKAESLENLLGDDAKMWGAIAKEGYQWWANLELLPWGKELYERMQKLGTVYILTSPGNIHRHNMQSAQASCGKILWIHKHFPDGKIIIAYDKEACASPDSFLVDDTIKKIVPFTEAGGSAFLWPNQYKLFDGDLKIENVWKELEAKVSK